MIKEKRICVFGDSIVSNEFYHKYNTWVGILLKHISKLYNENRVYNQGISGEITTDLLRRIELEAKARDPNIVIIHIGSNDANLIKNRIRTSEKIFVSNFKQIILISKKYTKDVLVTGLTPCDESKTTPTIWSKDEFYLNKNIKRYNEIIKSICKNENVYFMDIFNNFKTQKNYTNMLVKKDGMHLNKKGNEYFAKKIIDFGKTKKMW